MYFAWQEVHAFITRSCTLILDEISTTYFNYVESLRKPFIFLD